MSIVRRKTFGTAPNGQPADLYVMTNASGASVEMADFGGIIRAINVPDREGKLGNVVLGYQGRRRLSRPLCGYLGALIGRVGNRIAGGECELDGEKYDAGQERGRRARTCTAATSASTASSGTSRPSRASARTA